MLDLFINYQKGPMAYYMLYTEHPEKVLRELADLNPKVCAAMHGSTFLGDARKAILHMAAMMKEIL